MSKSFEALRPYMEKAMAFQAAQILFEWDNETLAPEEADKFTSKTLGILSQEYQRVMTCDEVKKLLKECGGDDALTEEEQAIVRVWKENLEELQCIPPEEYRQYAELTAKSARIWAKARKDKQFDTFASVLEEIITWQKKFASYRAKDGQKLYNVMLSSFEKDFDMEALDAFFGTIKEALVPLVKQVVEKQKTDGVDDGFLCGEYSDEKQEEIGRFLAEYVGFDFSKGVMATSAHPFTTNLHNHDVRITTHYSEHVDSSIFSVIHEAGHAIYEFGIRDSLTQTMAGQGASMAMHESQSRFFENIIGRSPAFWEPVYEKLTGIFPEQLKAVDLKYFVKAVNKVQPGLIRTQADELTYCLHVLIRYEIEKMIVEEELDVKELPAIWNKKYEEYLGITPEDDGVGVLQDIHWSQGSFGYFPSYALGSAFAAQIYAHMKKEMDFEGLLRAGRVDVIRDYLRENIHQYGMMKTSRELIKDVTGEDFTPEYYIQYLREKYLG